MFYLKSKNIKNECEHSTKSNIKIIQLWVRNISDISGVNEIYALLDNLCLIKK